MANYDIFDEKYYLSQYPWLKPAIDAGIIKSGKEHFEKFGQAAGLTRVSRYFDEDTYLAGNPDIAPFVRTPNNPNAPFATGLDHFIQYGYEGISPATAGFRQYESDGSNEFDTLIGGSGRDTFVLGGTIQGRFGPFAQYPLYIGPGFATIRNFTQGQDTIVVNPPFEGILMFPINNNQDLAIQTRGYSFIENGVTMTRPFDTIAVIEGGGNLKLNPPEFISGYTFLLG